MDNQNSKVGVIVLTIILTAVVVGGGVFFFQQNSVKELREEVKNLQKTTAEDEEVTTAETGTSPSTKTPVTKDNTASLPAGVEWLTYSDGDISFTYPKTFLGTSFQEDFDKNMGRTQWEVIRQDNIIYIRPTFESPAAEFGATFQIELIPTLKEAERRTGFLKGSIEGPESDKGESLNLNVKGYTVVLYRDVDLGFGVTGNMYSMIPALINGKQTPPWLWMSSENVYQNYVKDILIPSIKIK